MLARDAVERREGFEVQRREDRDAGRASTGSRDVAVRSDRAPRRHVRTESRSHEGPDSRDRRPSDPDRCRPRCRESPPGRPSPGGIPPGTSRAPLSSTPSARSPLQVNAIVTQRASGDAVPTDWPVPTLSTRPASHARPAGALAKLRNSYRAASAGVRVSRKC